MVRVCTAEDARRLGHEYADRWLGQLAGRWELLTAWAAGRLIGAGQLRWEGPFIPEVAERLPGQVEIGFLQVVPDRRGQGVGTALVGLAEMLCRERGIPSLGLAVGDENPRAQSLYRRLGYHPNGVRYVVRYSAADETGHWRSHEEAGIYMIKSLSQQ